MRLWYFMLLGALMLTACDDKQICYPQDHAEFPTGGAGSGAEASRPQPTSINLVIDRSWGMAGFTRLRPNAGKQPSGEFSRVLLAVAARLKPSVFQLPEGANNNEELQTIDLASATREASFNCGDNNKCGEFLISSLLSKFLERARGPDDNLRKGFKSLSNSESVILLVTDLQPDGNVRELNRMGLIQQEFQKILEDPTLAIGVLPVPARFFGVIYDTDVKGLDPKLLAEGQKQPFFLIPIGKKEKVRWVMDRLKQVVVDTNLPLLPEHVFSRPSPPSGAAVAFVPSVSQAGAPGARLVHPPSSKDRFYEELGQRYFKVKSGLGDATLKSIVVKPLNSTQSEYSLARPQMSAQAWEYVGGAYMSEDCRKRWRDFDKKPKVDPIDASRPEEFGLGIDKSKINGLIVGAVYYVEARVKYELEPTERLPPPWVANWNVIPKSDAAEVMRRAPRIGGVTFGVNSLQQLFQDTHAAEKPIQQETFVRYAIEVEG